MKRHLPARAARLGRGDGAADHGREHLRRHLVRQGLEGAGSTDPEFVKATKFYVDLVRKHGESGAAQSGFAECLNNMTQGKSAMWYDATSAAGSLEAEKSPVKGKIGYAPAPPSRRPTPPAGSTPGPGASRRPPATRTRRGSSSPGPPARSTSELVGKEFGWSNVPAGKRASTYDEPRVPEGGRRLQARPRARPSPRPDPRDPGVQPRPAHRHPVRRTSPSSPTSAPRSPRRSARPSPDASPWRRP